MNNAQTEEKTLLVARRFRVNEATRTTPTGQTITREVVRHPGSVVILPVWADGQVTLIQNFRLAAGQTLIELPAGTLEPAEDHLLCAQRELTEETGLHGATWQQLTSFYAAPGILDEHMHLFLATDLTAGPPQREEGEEIENLQMPWDEAMELVRSGKIRDAKTIVGLLYYDCFQRSQR